MTSTNGAKNAVPTRSIIRIALLGCGTAGGGALDLLLSQAATIEDLGGAQHEAAAIVLRSLAQHCSAKIPSRLFRDDIEMGLADPSIDLIESVGSLEAGRHYVTSALMPGPKLRALASKHGVSPQSEAAVGGAIPIVRTIVSSLAGERILEVGGIVPVWDDVDYAAPADGGPLTLHEMTAK